MKKSVSVIIRTKNEEQGIERCLLSLLSQESDYDIEIVVVDSGSTDRTLEIAGKYPVTIVNIAPEDFTYGYSLNVGIKKAKGHYVAVISAHSCPVNNSWVQYLVSPLGNEGVVASFGKDVNDPLKKSPFDAFLKSFQANERVVYTEKTPFTNTNCAIVRDIALKLPFNEQIPASEDKIWANRVLKGFRNATIIYEPKAMVYHTDKLTPKEVFRKRRLSGQVHFILNKPQLNWRSVISNFISGIKGNYKFLFNVKGYAFGWYFLIPVYHLAKIAGYYAGYKKALNSANGVMLKNCPSVT